MKKKLLIPLLLVFSIVSCTSEDNKALNENLKKTVNADLKKQEILNQFIELGLDQKNVSFVDTLNSSNSIKINSIEELKKFLTDIKNNKDQTNNVKHTIRDFSYPQKTTIKPRFFNDFSEYERSYNDGNVRVPSSIYTNLYYGFSYNSMKLKYILDDGITNVYSGIRGFTFGISYSQDYAETDQYKWDSSVGTYIFYIHGILHYNIFVEGIGTVYSQRVKTTVRFNPPEGRYSYQMRYIFAYLTFN